MVFFLLDLWCTIRSVLRLPRETASRSKINTRLDETVLWSKSLRTIPGVWIRAWWGLHRREIRVAHVKKRPIFLVSYLIFKFRVELVT